MTTQIFTSILVICFFGLMIGVGLYCRKKAASVDGFVLGGRSVGPWLTAFAFGTSYFSAVIFVGYAGQFGWNFGLASTWIGLGNAFIGSLLAWNVLGRRTRIMTQHLDSKTMPDFFEKRFGSSKLKIVASIIVFVFLIPYTASLYNGLSSLFGIAFAIPYWVCILIMAVLTGVYVVFGGYMATAINDFIQGLIMLGGIVAVVIAVLMQNGGLAPSVELLAEQSGWEYTSLLGPDPVSLITVVLLTSLGTWGLPQMIGKFYAISNEGAIKKGTIISTVFAIIVAGGCYFLGGFGRLFAEANEKGTPVGGFDSVVPTMISELSPYIIGIVIVLVLSASMSTLSSLVLTSASTLTLDMFVPIFSKKGVSEKKKLLTLRILIVFFIAISAGIAILKDTVWKESAFIAQMMGISWGALAGSFLAPFLYGLYWKKVTRPAVWTSFGFGVGIMVTQLVLSMCKLIPESGFIHFVFQNSLYTGVIAMLCGLVIVPIVSLCTQKRKPDNVEDVFECYNKDVKVKHKQSLGE
ncbi:MAG: sodium:solute symporter [Ruminococcaceae bacterium]|nr:sodium:solute symporter [Oscillospiraceae bacterium]